MPVGNIWASADPNTADDGDLCRSMTVKNVCGDGVTTCSTSSECTACHADGSAVIFSLADSDATVDYLEIENFDAWLQAAVRPRPSRLLVWSRALPRVFNHMRTGKCFVVYLL